MHKAPAVSCLLAPSGFQRSLIQGAWVLAAATCLGFYWDTRSLWATGCLVAISVVVGLLCWRCLAREARQVGRLSWDDASWAWTGFNVASPCQLFVHLDIQGVMLVRLIGDDGSSAWLWLERKVLVTQWVALRRAIFATGRAGHRFAQLDQARKELL